jgi:hypothetical protein
VQEYKILEEAPAGGPKLGEISDKYATAAEKSTEVHLPKKKLQDLELRKVLMGLLAMKLIAQTTDDHFLVQKATMLPPNAYQAYSVSSAVETILDILASEGAGIRLTNSKRR